MTFGLDLDALFQVFDITSFDALMILVGALLFFTLWRLFDNYSVSHFQKLIEEREAATVGAQDAAADISRRADRLFEDYDAQLIEARVAAMQLKIKKLAAAGKEASEIIARAENEASRYLEAQRLETEQAMEKIKSAVLSDLDSAVSLVVDRVKSARV
jgi:F0F1-type ATP synthase membrane subunit b/b'